MTGKTITLKTHPKLSLCTPYLTQESDWMIITAPGMTTLLAINCHSQQTMTFPLSQLMPPSHESHTSLPSLHANLLIALASELRQSQDDQQIDGDPDPLLLLGSIELCWDCKDAQRISKIADDWFTSYLEIDCTLVTQSSLPPAHAERETQEPLPQKHLEKSFSNSGQFLMVSRQSIADLQDKVGMRGGQGGREGCISELLHFPALTTSRHSLVGHSFAIPKTLRDPIRS
jgi:hypothetical protein